MPHPRTSVLLGVCGSSSATATASLVDLLQRYIAPSVTTVCTPAAAKFIDLPYGTYVDDGAWGCEPLHIDLTAVAQEFIVCPATVNTLAKAALGLADNLLTTCVLAYRGPIWWVPCANRALWDAPTTQAHVDALRARGHRVPAPRPMPGLARAGRSAAVGLEGREVVDTVLRAHLEET